jgi:acetoacetate decarboxylase
MKKEQIKKEAFSLPFTNPTYPKAPFRFTNREYLIITYETEMDLLKKIVPEPLEVKEPFVKYEFIKMPDSSGFGSYTESGQVIPVIFNGKEGDYVHSMYLDSEKPIAAGREIWGFPKTYGYPSLFVDKDVLIGKLLYQHEEVARASMSFKEEKLDCRALEKKLAASENFLLKILPDVTGIARICELTSYFLTEIHVKEAYCGKAELSLFPHVMAPVANLPCKKVVSAMHFIADLTLPFGKVVYDYLK